MMFISTTKFLEYTSVAMLLMSSILSLASCNAMKIATNESLVLLRHKQNLPTDNFDSTSYPSESQPTTGINIQTGYEGYLIPILETVVDDRSVVTSHALFQKIGKYLSTLTNLLPSVGSGLLYVGSKFATVVGISMLFLAVGSLFTTFLCVFTPFCTVHFSHFDQQYTDDIMRGLLTPEKADVLNSIVKTAIRKYRDDRNKPTL